MQTYILLMNLTEQGAKNIKEAGKRVEAAEKVFASMGGKLLGMYAVMGEYDYVAIGEIPNDEAAMSFLLSLASLGNVKTKTLRAFPQKEFVKIVKKLP
ncbi:MAG: GYD domain-containing protein [Chloroflexi bacterium]|nr:GYD domain-containing protein [Chloroflexota bacterium]